MSISRAYSINDSGKVSQPFVGESDAFREWLSVGEDWKCASSLSSKLFDTLADCFDFLTRSTMLISNLCQKELRTSIAEKINTLVSPSCT